MSGGGLPIDIRDVFGDNARNTVEEILGIQSPSRTMEDIFGIPHAQQTGDSTWSDRSRAPPMKPTTDDPSHLFQNTPQKPHTRDQISQTNPSTFWPEPPNRRRPRGPVTPIAPTTSDPSQLFR